MPYFYLKKGPSELKMPKKRFCLKPREPQGTPGNPRDDDDDDDDDGDVYDDDIMMMIP